MWASAFGDLAFARSTSAVFAVAGLVAVESLVGLLMLNKSAVQP